MSVKHTLDWEIKENEFREYNNNLLFKIYELISCKKDVILS